MEERRREKGGCENNVESERVSRHKISLYSTWASWDTLANNMRQNLEIAVYHILYC